MKQFIYNNDKLVESDITDVVIRMKVLLINGDKIMLGYERGIYQFPGGHLEADETFNECIKREILEETGIEIIDEDIKEPIYKIVYLNKDYPEIGKNRKSEIYYYVIKTNKHFDVRKTNYTENELSGNFKIEEISIDSVIKKLRDNIYMNEKNKVITPDMIMVIEEYNKLRNID